jgi:putative FmdB family regulatory protein
MPTYDYRCAACGHELEVFQSITESPKRKCPACKKRKLERRIGGGAAFLFKGSGFYVTDYRSDSYKKAADAEKGSPAPPASAPAPAKAPAAEKKAPRKTPPKASD